MTDKELLIEIRDRINKQLEGSNPTPQPTPEPPVNDGSYSIERWEHTEHLHNGDFKARTSMNLVVIVRKNGEGVSLPVVFELPTEQRVVTSNANGGASVNNFTLPKGGAIVNIYLKDFPQVSTEYRIKADGVLDIKKSDGGEKPSEPEQPVSSDLVDVDGKVYRTVQIGSQIWSAENWDCSKLADGTPIENIKNPDLWKDKIQPAWAYYGNDKSKSWGKLYNHYALKGLAPDGWRVATDSDWKQLESYLGENAGAKLKSTEHFVPPLSDKNHHYYNPDFIPATNETGFSALPSGSLNSTDTTHEGAGFYSRLRDADFWTGSEESGFGVCYSLSFNRNGIYKGLRPESWGMPIRLVR